MDFSLQSPLPPHIERSSKSSLETGIEIRNALISISDEWFPSHTQKITYQLKMKY